MSDSKVAQWLDQLSLAKYIPVFNENEVEWDQLRELNNEDLKEIGVLALGHRKRLIGAIAELASEQTSLSPDTNSAQFVPSGEAERRQLTVMFCDLIGSTELSELLDPEDLQKVTSIYQDLCAKAIERYEGFVARYMGDGVLAYFGYPTAHEDDAERAINAGLSLVESVKTVQLPVEVDFQIRVGIATGPVVVGDIIGKGISREISVTGTTPNLAARLQSVADHNSIIVSPVTYRLTSGRYTFRDHGPQNLKGIEQPVNIWQVVSEKSIESRFGIRQQPLMSALVGRDEEVELLTRRWKYAQAGKGNVVLITGEAGIGKSRLCESIVTGTADSPHILCRVQCSPHHTSSALHPLINHIKNAAEIAGSNSNDKNLFNLKSFLKRSDRSLPDTLGLVSALLSLEGSNQVPGLELEQSEQKDRTLRALVNLYTGQALKKPAVIIVEDLHWVDPSTQEFLDMLIDEIQEYPLLLVTTFRQSYNTDWIGQAHISLITLNRIGKTESLEILSSIARSTQLSEETVSEIIKKSDGIPLFIEEVTRAVLDTVEYGSDAGVIEVPATLQDSLAARLDRLGAGRRVIQTGAAIGREFSEELIVAVSTLSKAEITLALRNLLESGLLSRRGNGLTSTYVFKHALLQDAAYNSLLLTQRADIHQAIALALTSTSPEDFELLAHHWELADQPELATSHWQKAAERSQGVYDRSEAIDQYWRALDLMDPPATTEARAQQLAILLTGLDVWVLWRNEAEKLKAMRHFDVALSYALEVNDLKGAASLAVVKGFHTDDEALIKTALWRAEQSGDPSITAFVSEMYSDFLGRLGRYDDSRSHASRAIQFYGQLGLQVQQGMALVIQGRCYSARAGKLEEAFQYAQRARQIANSVDDKLLNASLVMECEPCVYSGLWVKTIEIAERELPLALELNNWTPVLFAAAWAAKASIKLQRFDDAQRYIDQARNCTLNRANLEFGRSYFLTAVSLLHLSRGQHTNALAAARESVELATDNNYLLELGAAKRTLGQVLAACDEQVEALDAYLESLEILNKIQSKPELAQTLLAYGKFTLKQNLESGVESLNRALALFTEMNSIGWIAETEQAFPP